MEAPTTFGMWLRQRRAALRLTRPELAQHVGCSVSALRKIEDGDRRPSLQIAELLALRLELPPAEQSAFVKVARGEWPVARLGAPTQASAAPHQVAALPAARPRLPAALSPLIGRQAEVTELSQFLRDPGCRALTLVGPGGIGKTRLALEAATRAQDAFADGVAFVALAAASTPQQIVPLIAEALGFPFARGAQSDLQTQLFASLREQRVLLLLDNLEQLTGEPGIVVLAELLAQAPDVKLLLTSRAALGLRAEWIFEVRGLPVPADPDTPADGAVTLFLERARRAQVGFVPSPDDAEPIRRICGILEGNPLAIELAASWVRTLSCAEIAQELARGLDFLQVAAPDLPARHRSLRAVFDHSWALLGANEQHALRQLAVFRGGFRREAAAALGVGVGDLAALVGHSLLRRHESGRYDLHELIRQFAAERLVAHPDELRAAEERHARYYLHALAEADTRLRSAAQPEALVELTAELENFRAAWYWAVDTSAFTAIEPGLRTMILLFDIRGWLQDGYELTGGVAAALERVAQQGAFARDEQLALGHLLTARSVFAFRLGHYLEAQALLERSLGLVRPLGEPRVLVEAVTFLAVVSEQLGDYTRSAVLYEEGLAIATTSGDAWFAALCRMALYDQASNVVGTLPPEPAYAEGQAVVAAWRATGDPRFTAVALNMLAWSASGLERYDEARTALEESVALSTGLGDRWGLGFAYRGLGIIAQNHGAHHEAIALFRLSLETLRSLGARQDVARVLADLGRSVLALGGEAEAEGLWREALQVASETHGTFITLEAMVGLAQLHAGRGELDAAVELLDVVLDHPASTRDTLRRAAQLRDTLERRMPPQEGAARAGVQAVSVDHLVAALLSHRHPEPRSESPV